MFHVQADVMKFLMIQEVVVYFILVNDNYAKFQHIRL